MDRNQLETAARTVSHLAGYLDELKIAAVVDLKAIKQRSYVTPSEEEKLRQLQVSYWQSRAALIEVVDTLRHDTAIAEEDYGQAFLTAYAAAILLVDAARFVREHFHSVAPVRQKLDEPAPAFGIPEGMYSRIQKSLTSPRHAWHLYHANQYYDEHEQELRALAQTGRFREVLDVIERLHERVNPQATVYLKARVKVRARSAAHRVRHDLFGQALYGIQKLFSSMMADVYVRRDHHPQIPNERRRELVEHLEPGDVLVVRKEYALTNYFLPGYWPHAALYLGKEQELKTLGIDTDDDAQHSEAEPRRVLEAMKDGVRVRPLDSPFASDSVVVLRPRLTRIEISDALRRGLEHEGKSYDFDFDFSQSNRLVCTEVVYRAFEGVGGITFPLVRRAGRNTLAAGDLIRMALARTGFEPLVVYSPAHHDRLLCAEEARQVLAREEGEEPGS